jgi:hypothetical protein
MRTLPDYLAWPVRLTEERLEHILAHPEMMGLDSAIDEILSHPEAVVQSRTDPGVRLCHRRHVTARFGEKWLCVVVKYTADDAFVLTAYLTDKIKTGEILWPKT